MTDKTKEFVEAIIHAYERGYEKAIADEELAEEVLFQEELDNLNFLIERDDE